MHQIVEGDAFETLASLPTASVDLVILDIPYGQTAAEWDKRPDLCRLWELLVRIRRNKSTPIIWFCTTKLGMAIANAAPKKVVLRHDLVWVKDNFSSPLRINKSPPARHEMLLVFSEAAPYYKRIDIPNAGKPYKHSRKRGTGSELFGIECTKTDETNVNDGSRCATSVLEYPKPIKQNIKHSTPKPVELYKFLIDRYCADGGTVLDPFAGSFNSLAACLQCPGKRYIGIELNAELCRQARVEYGIEKGSQTV